MSEQNKQVVIRFNKEFIEQNNQRAFQEIVADHFINHSAPPGASKGRDGMQAFMNMFHQAFDRVEVVIHTQIAELDKVVTHKEIRAHHKGDFMGIPATGKTVTLPVIDIIRLENGQYAEHWAVRDMGALMQQLKSI